MPLLQTTDVADRVAGISIEKHHFLPDGATEPIIYTQLVMPIMINGDKDELRIKLTRDQAKVLIAAQVLDEEDFLGESSTTPKK